MIVKIDDKSLDEIMVLCIKEEVALLMQDLLQRPKMRKLLWDYTCTGLVAAGMTADLPPETVDAMAAVASTEKQPKSGAGGGGTGPEDDPNKGSGGGGGSRRRTGGGTPENNDKPGTVGRGTETVSTRKGVK